MVKSLPNVLITGTPGTGKTSLSEMIQSTADFQLNHINVSDLVKERKLYDEYNEEFDTLILNEDKLCDELEEVMQNGGNIVDFHSSDFFPERWFSIVIVLVNETHIIYDRLLKRGYSTKKINENVECEIMQVVVQEATESYKPDIVHILQNNDINDLENNAAFVINLIKKHMQSSE